MSVLEYTRAKDNTMELLEGIFRMGMIWKPARYDQVKHIEKGADKPTGFIGSYSKEVSVNMCKPDLLKRLFLIHLKKLMWTVLLP